MIEVYVGDKVIFLDSFGRRSEGKVSSVLGHICEVETGNERKIFVAVNDILKAVGWRERNANRKTIIRNIDTDKCWWNR